MPHRSPLRSSTRLNLVKAAIDHADREVIQLLPSVFARRVLGKMQFPVLRQSLGARIL